MSDIEFETNDAEIATDFLCDIELINAEQLRAAVGNAGSPIPLLKKALQESSEVLHSRYKQNLNVTNIVCGRAWAVDEVLRLAWDAQNWPSPNNISLVAVGGYGRGELLPHSDIDLLLLTRKNRDNKKYKDYISAFLTMLWALSLIHI